ncbi:MAG: sporulation protein YunB [Ruminococcus sp.]|nr:sporulation protein YunB [Ruminococcus sp.]
MRTDKTTRGKRLIAWLFTAAAVAGVTVSALYSEMTEQAKEVCAYKARQTVNEIAAEEVSCCLSEQGAGGDYLDINYRGDGSVGAVRADAVKINSLENRLRTRINERLSALDDIDIGVPVGTLTGVSFLNERGFSVRMMLQLEGAAEVRLTGGLESAGVNQTRHVLRLEISCDVLAQLPGHSEKVTADGEYVIAETVIVGGVPSSYYDY